MLVTAAGVLVIEISTYSNAHKVVPRILLHLHTVYILFREIAVGFTATFWTATLFHSRGFFSQPGSHMMSLKVEIGDE